MSDSIHEVPVTVHADNEKLAKDIHNFKEVVQDAARADEDEHRQGFKEAFRIHKKAVFWSVLLSAALVRPLSPP